MRRLALPPDLDQLTLDADLVAAVDRQGQRLVAVGCDRGDRLDEELVQSARLDQPVQARVAAPREEGRIGIERLVETIDQDADRQPVQHRPCVGAGLEKLGWVGSALVLVRQLGRVLVAVLDTGEALRELARELAKSAAFDRAQGGRALLRGNRGEEHDVLGRPRLGRRHLRRQRLRRQRLGGQCLGGQRLGGQRLGRSGTLVGWGCWRCRVDGGRGSGMALMRQSGEPCEIAADAEPPIAAENPIAVEHRQSRKLDGKPLLAVVDRPDDVEPAPGVMGGDGARDLTLGVEAEPGGHLRPGPPDGGGGPRADQSDEFVGAEREAAVFTHLPDEAQRMAPFGRGRNLRRGGRRRRGRGRFGCGRGDRLGPRLR